MYSSVTANAGRSVSMGIKKHLGVISALIFSLVLSACGGGGGGGDNPGPAVSGAPTLSEVSISSGELTTVTVGDKVTVTISASEAILAPSVMIGGVAVDRVVGSGRNWTADRVMLETDTAGVLSLSVSFSDVGGETGAVVTEATDGSSLTFEINAEAGNVVDGPFQYAKVYADFNSNGIHDDGEPSTLTDEDGAYSLVETSAAIEGYPIVVEMTDDTIDAISGESFAATGVVLRATSGGSVVTPMTSLLVAMQAADPTYTAGDLAIDMGLPVGVDVVNFNPFAADADAAVAHEVEKVFQQVMTATLIVAEAMAGLGEIADVSLSSEEASAAALKALANTVLASTAEVDLSDDTQVAALQAAAKIELAANGVEVSAAVADFVLGQASDVVAQVAATFDGLSADDFGTAAASAVSLLKHDATAELASMSAAAATFLESDANTDLAGFDAAEFISLNTENGVNSAVAANEDDVNLYLSGTTLEIFSGGVLLEGASLKTDAQDGGDNASEIALAPSITDPEKQVIQISTNDSTKSTVKCTLGLPEHSPKTCPSTY
jgi:hypothetical protein